MGWTRSVDFKWISIEFKHPATEVTFKWSTSRLFVLDIRSSSMFAFKNSGGSIAKSKCEIKLSVQDSEIKPTLRIL